MVSPKPLNLSQEEYLKVLNDIVQPVTPITLTEAGEISNQHSHLFTKVVIYKPASSNELDIVHQILKTIHKGPEKYGQSDDTVWAPFPGFSTLTY